MDPGATLLLLNYSRVNRFTVIYEWDFHIVTPLYYYFYYQELEGVIRHTNQGFEIFNGEMYENGVRELAIHKTENWQSRVSIDGFTK